MLKLLICYPFHVRKTNNKWKAIIDKKPEYYYITTINNQKSYFKYLIPGNCVNIKDPKGWHSLYINQAKSASTISRLPNQLSMIQYAKLRSLPYQLIIKFLVKHQMFNKTHLINFDQNRNTLNIEK